MPKLCAASRQRSRLAGQATLTGVAAASYAVDATLTIGYPDGSRMHMLHD